MNKTAIITGVTGQDGSHLADLLLSKDYEVWGVVRRSSVDTTERVRHLAGNPKFNLIDGDITDYSSIIRVLQTPNFVDEFYNLAAQSHVGISFKEPALTWDITGQGVFNCLQALLDLDMLTTRFYQASSSEMFGSEYDIAGDGTKYQNEDTKLMPNSPYAISKVAGHHAVRMFRDAYGLHGSCGILFNHEGPRRGGNFVTQKIIKWVKGFQAWIKECDTSEENLEIDSNTKTIVCTKCGRATPMLGLGNLEACRDWGYAGDYVEAMWMMLQQDYADDYVICTGKTYSIKDFLALAFCEAGVTTPWEYLIYIDPAFYRPSEVEYLRGDCTKAREKLGWIPKHDLRGLVQLMLED